MKSNIILFILCVPFLFFPNPLSANSEAQPVETGLQATNLFSEVIVISNYNGYALSCPGASDAVAMIYPFAGQPPFTYLWSSGQTTQQVAGLSAGPHTITVTDGQGAIDLLELFIVPPPPINIIINQIGANSLAATVSGGIPPYTFVWSTGFQMPQINGLSAGLYELTVHDVNGCTESANFEIVQVGPGWVIYPGPQFHNILIPGQGNLTVNGDPFEPGDQIGVFYDSLGTLACGGYLVWQGVNDTLKAYGNSLTTTNIEGFNQGEEFIWKIWDASRDEVFKTNVQYQLTAFPNTAYYAEFGTSAITMLQGYVQQAVTIPEGWSYMSTYINPFDADIPSVFSTLYQSLIILKDENGEVVFPAWNLNTIGPLIIGEGYQIKMNTLGGTKSAFILYINGIRVEPDTPIELRPGWNIISFLYTEEYPIDVMLGSIDPYIGIVKDDVGNVYIPAGSPGGPLNTIGNMKPGKGYKIKIISSNNVILEYPVIPNKKSIVPKNKPGTPKHYGGIINTGNNHTVIFTARALPFVPEKGDEIAVLSNNGMAGSAQFYDNNFCIAVFGDDETTQDKDGPVAGNILHFKYWDESKQAEIDFDVCHWSEGDGVYEIDKLSIAGDIQFDYETDIITISVYPNPNKGKFRLQLEGTGSISKLEITSTLGQILYESTEMIKPKQVFDFSGYSQGVYYAKAESNGKIYMKKIIVQ